MPVTTATPDANADWKKKQREQGIRLVRGTGKGQFRPRNKSFTH